MNMTDKEVMQMALDALEDIDGIDTETECVTIDVGEVIEALRAALAQPEKTDMQIGLTYEEANPPEELARLEQAMIEAWKPIPKKEWVGLTDEEILEEYRQSYGDDGNLTDVYFARAIEAKLKEKNATT